MFKPTVDTTRPVQESETIGELIRQAVLIQSIERACTARHDTLGAERATATLSDYREHITNRMIALELAYITEGPYYARLFWIPASRQILKIMQGRGHWNTYVGEINE